MTAVLRLDSRLLAAYGAAAGAVLIWGATPVATKLAVGEFDPVTAGILRTMLAATVVLPLAMARRMPLPATGRHWGLLALSATGGFLAFTLLFSLGVKHTSAGHAALINAGIPIFTGLFGAVAERRVPGPLWILGVAIAFAGEGVLIGFRGGAGSGEATVAGDLLCLASSAAAGLGYVSGSRLSMRIGTLSTTFWGIGIAGLVQVPLLAAVWGATDWPTVTAVGWSAVLYLAFGSTVLGYIGWYWALAAGGVVRIAPVQFAQLVVSLFLAVTILDEVLTMPLILGSMAVLGGIAMARRG